MRATLNVKLAGLGGLLGAAKGDFLQTVLSTLQCMLERDAGVAARWQASITPVVLRIWATHLHDPLLTLTLLDIFRALAAAPPAAANLQVRTSVKALRHHRQPSVW